MNIKYYGRFVDVTDSLRDYAEKKINKLDWFFGPEADAQVKFTLERGSKNIAEITITMRGMLFRAEEITDDMYASIDSAVDKLSQEGGNPKKTPLKEGAPGHGCGHCTLGVGSAGGAIALKTIMAEEGLPGTVIYFGCPAEEGAGAKQFMARAGMFDEVDFVYTWHPSTLNTVKNASSNAIMGANFSFTGKTAHAGACPWEGRSALDAVELMNVGTNYRHEHMRDGERIHYAYADAGGTAPNVVPDYARIKYEVRAPRVDHMLRLFERVGCHYSVFFWLYVVTKGQILHFVRKKLS